MTAFTTGTADLREAVAKVVRAVSERPVYPVLKGILLTASDGWVEVLATDLTATHRVKVPADVTVSGRVLVDAVMLARIARHLPGEQAALELDEKRWNLTITSGRARFSLLTMPEGDYPTDLPADADLTKVRAAGPDSHERELAVPDVFAVWKPPGRRKALYAPEGVQPGAPLTWWRKDGEAWAEVSGQVWSGAPMARAVWAVVEGERRPSLVVEHTYGDHRYQETVPHWVAFPKTTTTERSAA